MTLKHIPKSVIIVGSGVFGLSTALALAKRQEFVDNQTEITVLERIDFPAKDGSSVDSSRIVRAEYADSAYAELMVEAHEHWRGDYGRDGRYTESGLVIALSDKQDSAQDYMQAAVKNVKDGLGLREGRREEGGQVELLTSPSDIKRVLPGMTGHCGNKGYVNWTAGWAHAENGVRYTRALIEQTGRVHFRTAQVQRLYFSSNRVTHLTLSTGETLSADLIILATGAWTPSLIDLRGIASATGQILSYLPLTPTEQARLGANPTLIDASNGMFIISPQENTLKVARHGYGYANLRTIPHPEDPSLGDITVSLPRTAVDDPDLRIPEEGVRACREFLATTNPDLKDRAFSHTRICWYTDTPKGNWLVTYHPRYENLFVATGGSGHGYKFLPVVGERFVDVILGQDRDDLGRRLREKWAWPQERFKEDHVWTCDWRGGAKGMILDEEPKKSYSCGRIQ